MVRWAVAYSDKQFRPGISTQFLHSHSYGLPGPIVPQGLTPLASIYGKGKNRFPLLVTFSHPPDWVVTLPSIDINGEDGTIQAGEYAKGDTATLFVNSELGHVKVRAH